MNEIFVSIRKTMKKRSSVIFLLALSLISSLYRSEAARAAEKTPAELQGVGINPILGTKISLSTEFQDEEGKAIRLEKYFDGKRPVILIMSYYGCPMLCGLLLNAARESFEAMDWVPGENFQIVTVSIDPRENFKLAASKKESILGAMEQKGKLDATRNNWHFLVGKKESSQKLAAEIGFQYRYDEKENQFAHGAAMFLLSPSGKLTRVLYGVSFPPIDLKLGLLEASEGKIGSLAEKIVLFCYHYDPKGNQYAIFATNLMKLGGVITLAVIAFLYLLVFFGKRKKG